jgi:hypothetical protein
MDIAYAKAPLHFIMKRHNFNEARISRTTHYHTNCSFHVIRT